MPLPSPFARLRPRTLWWATVLAAAAACFLLGALQTFDKLASKPDASKPDASKPAASKPDDSKPEATKPDATKPDATKPEVSQPDDAEPDDSKPEVSQGPEASMIYWEFAGSAAESDRVLTAWGEKGRKWAWRGLIVDFAFIVAYVLAIGLGLEAFRRQCAGGCEWPGAALARLGIGLIVIAGLLDVGENVCLLLQWPDNPRDGLALWAARFALPKFVLVLATMLPALFGLWGLLRHGLRAAGAEAE